MHRGLRSLGSGEMTGSPMSSGENRGRDQSEVTSHSINITGRPRTRTSFASSQRYGRGKDGNQITHGPLDREQSGREVKELLKLRQQRLKEAAQNGDELELRRLRNLNVFDDIEKGKVSNEEMSAVPEHQRSGRVSPEAGKNLTNGHTETLCSFMRFQEIHGAVLPKGTRSYASYPASVAPGISSSPTMSSFETSSTLASEATSSRLSLKTSPYSSSVQAITAPDSGYAESGASSTTTRHLKNEEDPFLYLGMYLRRRINESRFSGSQKSSAWTRRTLTRRVSCRDANCTWPLTGMHNGDCGRCKLPEPHPRILAAMQRIEYFEGSPISAQLNRDLEVTREVDDNAADVSSEIEEARQRVVAMHKSVIFKDLQLDLKFVEEYTTEMEKRAAKGIWWEAWLVIEDLKKKGIVGSDQRSKSRMTAFRAAADEQ